MAHIVHNSLTLINKTNLHIQANRDAINMLSATHKKLQSELNKLRIVTTKIMQFNQIAEQVPVVVQKVTLARQNLRHTVQKLSAALHLAIRGKISNDLITAKEMYTV